MTPRFTISVLTYTALPQAKRCIASVLKSTLPFKLILTANGNAEAAKYFNDVAAEHPFVTVVANEKNQGFIEPNKHAFSLCDTEFFVMLNDDAILPPDGLAKLAAPFDRFPKAALSGPGGDFQTLLPNFHGTKGKDFEYLCGAALCCKTEIVKKHGLFDPNLKWAYGEDSDLSLRMREKGYTLHKADFILQHEVAATSKHVPEVRANSNANHAYLIKRWAHYLKVRKMDYPIIVKRTAAWGDVLLTTPIIEALKRKYPLSPIHVETACGAIFVRNPHVSSVAPRLPRMPDALTFNLDMAYEKRTNVSILQAYADACGLAAGEWQSQTSFYVSDHDLARAKRLMPDGEWVALHVGPSTWRSKEWPKERFAELVAAIRGMGKKIVLVGNGNTRLDAHDLDQRNTTSVHEMAALIARAQLFVGLDSLPLHIACAMGTPAIGLFGVTDPKYILPAGAKAVGVCGTTPSFGVRHRTPGTTVVDDHGAAMGSITVEMVMDAVEKMRSDFTDLQGMPDQVVSGADAT